MHVDDSNFYLNATTLVIVGVNGFKIAVYRRSYVTLLFPNCYTNLIISKVLDWVSHGPKPGSQESNKYKISFFKGSISNLQVK